MNLLWLNRLQLPARALLPIARGARLCGAFPRFVDLPYHSACPVIYDKDEVINCYTDDYVMALAAAGRICLRGMLTSSSLAPYNQWVTEQDYERFLKDRAHSVRLARMSGMKNIPDPVPGPKGPLRKPASGRIEDTASIGSEGSWMLVREARMASAEKPLVVLAGTGLTAAADAWLLDPSIAGTVVVAWIGGTAHDMSDYNGWSDAWAAYIVLQKLRLVQFPSGQACPVVPKSRLLELPDTPLRKWMIEKQHPNGSPGSIDADAPPAISLTRTDYALRAHRVSFSHWIVVDGHDVPAFRKDKFGNTLVVTAANASLATAEWWGCLKGFSASGASQQMTEQRLVR